METMETETQRPLPQGTKPPFIIGSGRSAWTWMGIFLFMALVAWVGVLSVVLPKPTVSPVEKRDLAARPVLSVAGLFSGDFVRELDAHYADTFPMRDTLVQLAGSVKDLYGFRLDDMRVYSVSAKEQAPASSKPPTPSSDATAVAKPEEESSSSSSSSSKADEPVNTNDFSINDGTIIYKDMAFTVFGGSEAMATYYADVISQYRRELPASVRVFDMVIPTPVAYYLPERNKSMTNDEKASIDFIYKSLDPRVITVDAYTSIGQHTDEYIYYRTDHHWTALGAYYAYTAFCQAAGFTPVPLEKMERRRIEGELLGSMYNLTRDSRLAANPDYVDYYIMPGEFTATLTARGNPSKVQYVGSPWAEYATGVNGYAVFLHGDIPLERIDTSNKNGRRAVVIKESFGNAFAPFLFSHYEQVFVVDQRYFQTSLMDLVRENNITDVIFANNVYAANTRYHIDCINGIRNQNGGSAIQPPAATKPQEEKPKDEGAPPPASSQPAPQKPASSSAPPVREEEDDGVVIVESSSSEEEIPTYDPDKYEGVMIE